MSLPGPVASPCLSCLATTCLSVQGGAWHVCHLFYLFLRKITGATLHIQAHPRPYTNVTKSYKKHTPLAWCTQWAAAGSPAAAAPAGSPSLPPGHRTRVWSLALPPGPAGGQHDFMSSFVAKGPAPAEPEAVAAKQGRQHCFYTASWLRPVHRPLGPRSPELPPGRPLHRWSGTVPLQEKDETAGRPVCALKAGAGGGDTSRAAAAYRNALSAPPCARLTRVAQPISVARQRLALQEPLQEHHR